MANIQRDHATQTGAGPTVGGKLSKAAKGSQGRWLPGYHCCPALKMTMTPSLSMKTKMVALVATLTG